MGFDPERVARYVVMLEIDVAALELTDSIDYVCDVINECIMNGIVNGEGVDACVRPLSEVIPC